MQLTNLHNTYWSVKGNRAAIGRLLSGNREIYTIGQSGDRSNRAIGEFSGHVFQQKLDFNPRFSPRDPQNRTRDVPLYPPTYFHQDPTRFEWFRTPKTSKKVQKVTPKCVYFTLFRPVRTFFVSLLAWESVQTTSQDPNINP